jgi:hypothetical protein
VCKAHLWLRRAAIRQSCIARPGGNVTGGVAHIGHRTTWDLFGAETITAARSLGLEIVHIDLALPDVEGALRQAVDAQARVAIVRGRPFFSSKDAGLTVERAAAHRLPVIYESRAGARPDHSISRP